MKKSIALIMALSVLVCGVFAACSSKKTDGQNSAADTTQAGLANADTEFGTEINKDGKEKMYISRKLRYLDSGQQRRRMHHMQPLNLGLEDAIKRILTEVWKKGNGDMR